MRKTAKVAPPPQRIVRPTLLVDRYGNTLATVKRAKGQPRSKRKIVSRNTPLVQVVRDFSHLGTEHELRSGSHGRGSQHGIRSATLFGVKSISDPIPGPSNAFFSDWRFALGTGIDACGDNGKWNGGFTSTGDGKLTVVSTAGLGAPTDMANCLRVNLTSDILGDAGRMVQATGQWSIPAVGNSIYFRLYFRSDWTDGLSVGNPHFIQHGGLTPGMEWVYRAPGGDSGRGESQASSIETNFFASSGTYPNNNFAAGGYGHGTLTSSGVWNRQEWQFLRDTTNTAQLTVRIYNGAGVLTWTNVDMWGDLSARLSVANPSFPLTDLGGGANPTNQLSTINLGNNGPGSQPAGNNYFYFGGFAVNLSGFPGPYSLARG